MINRKNIWFLTLFSLVLVLSIYYITIPNEIFNEDIKKNSYSNININETDIISALKVEDDTSRLNTINELKNKLNKKELDAKEKSSIFEELKIVNKNSSLEESLENKIKKIYQYDSFVKINNNEIRVVVGTNSHSVELANKIMRLIQNEFDKKMYISVEFEK